MKIGIIVYSQTENTYSVALKLQDKLLSDGHEVNLERVIPVGEIPPRAKAVEFQNAPEVAGYDALVFGCQCMHFLLHRQ